MNRELIEKNEHFPDSWNLMRVDEAISINPKRVLRKGTLSKKVAMDKILPFTKKISGYELTEFSSGTKFSNHDTLLARITPCLENGKTAYVNILDDHEIGFGSTEFLVLSRKEGITTNEFVYYLATSPIFRAKAIASMTGTSGRQRVQNDDLSSKKVLIPSLQEQQAIAKILSDLDAKIELLQDQNNTLEAIGKALFKHWFVDFEFPNNEGKPYKSSGGEMVDSELGEIPKGWSVGQLKNIIANFDSKRVPLSSREREKRRGKYPYYGATSVMDYVDDYLFDGVYVLLGEDGSVVDEKGYPILQYVWGKFWVNNHAHILQGISGFSSELLYLLLLQTNIAHIVTGAVQPKISQKNMNSVDLILPPKHVLSEANRIVTSIFSSFRSNHEEIITLSGIRDSLLPKLMTGKIRVPVEVSP